jgi:D-lyxose ketol-isomerase
MKRSEINVIIKDAEAFLDQMNYKLPPWASWSPSDWEKKGQAVSGIVRNSLGWDITDFGSGNYRKRGLFLITVRNGNQQLDKKPYAEKIMIVDPDQETPMHFHWHKMEDIINRGGGDLVIQLYNSGCDEGLSAEAVRVSIDGVEKTLDAGSLVVLKPGESICLTPYLYHRFYAKGSRCLVGEVSMVNDDAKDNRFLEPTGRFPTIEEDEAPRHLLVSDYAVFLKGLL